MLLGSDTPPGSRGYRDPPGGGKWARAQTKTHRRDHLSRHPPGSQHLEPRPHARHTHTHTDSHAHTHTRAQTPPAAAPPRPLRAPPPALTDQPSGRPGWREVAASGPECDFPAARAPRSQSEPEVALGAASPASPPPARRPSEWRPPRLHGARVRPRCLSPAAPAARLPRPHPLSLSCAPSAPTPSSPPLSWCSLHPPRVPPGALASRPSASPAAPQLPARSAPQHWVPSLLAASPHPLPLSPPAPAPSAPFPLSLPTPPLRSPLSSLCA